MDVVIVARCRRDHQAGTVIVAGRCGDRGNTDVSGENLRSGNRGKYIGYESISFYHYYLRFCRSSFKYLLIGFVFLALMNKLHSINMRLSTVLGKMIFYWSGIQKNICKLWPRQNPWP